MASTRDSPLQDARDWETTDVLVCGGGPTGTLLSAYLARLGVKNTVLERERDIPPFPRAFAMGEESIRLLQGLGLYEHVFTDIGHCVGKGYFVSGRHTDMHRKPFFELTGNTSDGGTSHVTMYFFRQPTMEKHLRSVITDSLYSDFRVQSTVTSISEDEEWVYVNYSGADGEMRHIKSRFLVGADGKTGFTRKMYLEPRGVVMEKTHKYHDVWMSVNYAITLPTPETHPNFPLWKLGYTPDTVYASFFPDGFRMFANPDRFTANGLIGHRPDRWWRFESQILASENPVEMAKPENIKRVVFPYLTHAGKRYGLPDTVQFLEDCLDCRQAGPYTYVARTCNKWALNRVMLIGDAAHVFSPFGGQGINTGLLDANGLAWRLSVAMRPAFQPFPQLFRGWYMERKQHVDRALAFTVENGDLLTEKNPIKIIIRDWLMWAIGLFASYKAWRSKGITRKGMIRYQYDAGMVFLPQFGGGASFPQVYCVSVADEIEDKSHAPIMFTDDVIFSSKKQKLFQLVVLLDSVAGISDARTLLHDIDVDNLSKGEVLTAEITYIVHDPLASAPPNLSPEIPKDLPDSVVRVGTAEEFKESPLCIGRPEPVGYDMSRITHEMKGKKFIVVRPDRLVYAACGNRVELEEAMRSIVGVLNGTEVKTG